jgi:hypothetical protein
MSKQPPPQWTIPVGGDHAFELVITDDKVSVRRPVMVLDGTTRGATINVATLTPLEVTQLGMAMCEAGKVAGQLHAKRKRT